MAEPKVRKLQPKQVDVTRFDDARAGVGRRSLETGVDDALDLALADSFPASDPPQMTQPNVKAGGPERAHGGDKCGK